MEIELLQSESEEHFTVLEEPSEDVLGSFKIKLFPFTGGDKQYCSAELIVAYEDDASIANYKIVEDQVEGLSVAQIQELADQLEVIKSASYNVYDVICGVRDFLNQLNPLTVAAVKE
jgi:hypothetical protein